MTTAATHKLLDINGLAVHVLQSEKLLLVGASRLRAALHAGCDSWKRLLLRMSMINMRIPLIEVGKFRLLLKISTVSVNLESECSR